MTLNLILFEWYFQADINISNSLTMDEPVCMCRICACEELCEQLMNSIDYKIIINNLNIRLSICIEKKLNTKVIRALSLSLSFSALRLLSSAPATGGLLASTQAQPTRAPNHVQRVWN